MNKWVKESIRLAGSKGYLDKLYEVYPADSGLNRVLSRDLLAKLKADFKKRNKTELIKDLLKLPKFPIDDPYIASLRRHSFLLDKNPRTVERFGKRILDMGFNSVVRSAATPKKASRQLGPAFYNWLNRAGFKFFEENEFKLHKGICFLEGKDKVLKNFAEKELGVRGLKKGLDFIIKAKGKYVIGEAKFLTDDGGTQNNQFRDAISVATTKKNNVLGVAILDGIVWFESNLYMHRTVKSFRGNALTVLLLKKFIKGL